jgi:non-specific protein-tyrosine kinase
LHPLPPVAATDETGGLAAWLTAVGADEDAVARLPVQPTDLPGLSLVPAGPALAGTMDALDGPRLGLLVPALLERAERVVAVAPSLTRAADALPLARHVDGVILVVAAGRTTRADAVHARNTLQAAGGRVLGVVLGGA